MAPEVLPDIRSIKPGAMAAFDIEGRRVAVANADGVLFAFDDVARHLALDARSGAMPLHRENALLWR